MVDKDSFTPTVFSGRNGDVFAAYNAADAIQARKALSASYARFEEVGIFSEGRVIIARVR